MENGLDSRYLRWHAEPKTSEPETTHLKSRLCGQQCYWDTPARVVLCLNELLHTLRTIPYHRNLRGVQFFLFRLNFLIKKSSKKKKEWKEEGKALKLKLYNLYHVSSHLRLVYPIIEPLHGQTKFALMCWGISIILLSFALVKHGKVKPLLLRFWHPTKIAATLQSRAAFSYVRHLSASLWPVFLPGRSFDPNVAACNLLLLVRHLLLLASCYY